MDESKCFDKHTHGTEIRSFVELDHSGLLVRKLKLIHILTTKSRAWSNITRFLDKDLL